MIILVILLGILSIFLSIIASRKCDSMLSNVYMWMFNRTAWKHYQRALEDTFVIKYNESYYERLSGFLYEVVLSDKKLYLIQKGTGKVVLNFESPYQMFQVYKHAWSNNKN